jgi:hypothetical protein
VRAYPHHLIALRHVHRTAFEVDAAPARRLGTRRADRHREGGEEHECAEQETGAEKFAGSGDHWPQPLNVSRAPKLLPSGDRQARLPTIAAGYSSSHDDDAE